MTRATINQEFATAAERPKAEHTGIETSTTQCARAYAEGLNLKPLLHEHLLAALAWILWAFVAAIPISGQSLYDGKPGTLPSAQDWSYAALPGLAEQTQTGEAVRLNTTAANLESAGYARVLTEPLGLEGGFGVAMRFRLAAETHARAERAGFSLIVLGNDSRGLELGFWTNRVFAQADHPLFTHAEDAPFDFTADWVDLVLILRGTNYALSANGSLILTGPVRDYTAFTGFPDVYETPNFLFFGDDTTSAAGDVTIESVAIIQTPRLLPASPGVIQWAGLPGRTYTVESSGDLQKWSTVTTVTSITTQFAHTNAPASEALFFRVAFP